MHNEYLCSWPRIDLNTIFNFRSAFIFVFFRNLSNVQKKTPLHADFCSPVCFRRIRNKQHSVFVHRENFMQFCFSQLLFMPICTWTTSTVWHESFFSLHSIVSVWVYFLLHSYSRPPFSFIFYSSILYISNNSQNWIEFKRSCSSLFQMKGTGRMWINEIISAFFSNTRFLSFVFLQEYCAALFLPSE